MSVCTKAIIPVAGFGTRRLPITKAIEKCMIPVLNRPIIDYIVEDCVKAGITDIYFIVGEDSSQLRKYYGENMSLEQYLADKGKDIMLDEVREISRKANFHYITQTTDLPYGTTVPVWLCRDLIAEDEKVLVLMGDQFMYNADGKSEAEHFFREAAKANTPSALLVVEIPMSEVSNYGIVALTKQDENELYDKIVDRPSEQDAPSNLNNAGFYLFDKPFFEYLEKNMQQKQEGEHMITDAINEYVADGHEIAVVRNKGEYLDCGTVDGWLHANQVVAGK
jgi:UTP--glucose-1-phosphate uridylyltransferase